MRPIVRPTVFLLALSLLAPASALAGETGLRLAALDAGSAVKSASAAQPATSQSVAAQPAAAASTASSATVAAHPPLYLDKALAREHERFSFFARMQVARMNANIIGGRRHMRVSRGHDGLYHASYRAIDVPGVVCQVRRSDADPRYYVGSLIYTEEVLESTGKSARACRSGQFSPVMKEPHRIIFTSKRGGGWQ